MPDSSQRCWVVVYVMAGVPGLVEGYLVESVAKRRAEELWREINPENDDVAVFEVTPQ